MKKIVVFHHDDNDGKAAAAVIYHAYKSPNTKIEFISVNYNDKLPSANFVEKDDIVYIVDYSFTNATLQILMDIIHKGCEVGWIDHHKSSLEVIDYINKETYCMAIVDTKRSAALIAYDHFKEDLYNNTTYLNKDSMISEREFINMKNIISLVDDYDRWVHNDKNSILFNLGSQTVDTHPTSLFWISSPMYAMERGKIIKEHLDKKNEDITERNGFEIRINGHDCIVLNTPERSSQTLGKYFDEYKFAILFSFNGVNYSYSIYSELEDIDCAKIAQYFNSKGGGHKGAAGFVSNKHLFVKGQVFVI